jgi:gliding motility-associated lipoprotein GldH
MRLCFFPVTRYFLLIAALALFQGCETNTVYEKNIRLQGAEWNYMEKPEFSVDIDDTAATYAVYVNIRFEAEYNYSNLFFMVNGMSPDGKQQQQRIECELFDKDGLPLGKGLGDLFFIRYKIPRFTKFRTPGTYHFMFEQNMRIDHLKGIHDIGLRIEKH